MPTRTIALVLAGVLVGASCSDGAATTAPTAAEANPGNAHTSVSGDEREIPAEPRVAPGGRSRSGFRLAPFDGCQAFLDHVRGEAAARVQPWGIDPGGFHGGWELAAGEESAEAAMTELAATPAATMAPAAPPAGGDDAAGDRAGSGVVGTNVQEQGVDEADIVKTDGTRIVTLSNGVLTEVDIVSGRPVATGSLPLAEAWGAQLFLHGDRAYVIAPTSLSVPMMPTPDGPAPGGNAPATTAPVEITPVTVPLTAPPTQPPVTEPPVTEPPVTEPPVTEPPVTEPPVAEPPLAAVQGIAVIEIDLAGSGAPTVVSTLRVEGWLLSARLVGSRMLVAASTPPQWHTRAYDGSARSDEDAVELNRRSIAETGIEAWTPQYELTTPTGTTQGALLGCDRVHRPAEFAGFDMISLLDVDVSTGLPGELEPTAAVGVLASGQTVYASLDRFYVATNRWFPVDVPAQGDAVDAWNEAYTTDVHAFAIDSGEPVRYVSSGSVVGSLRNQFSMSEHDGFLRIFTTTGSPWGQVDSETRLVVLAEGDGQLEQIGAVGGLGRGETLYSARMIGDRGYAVTFRQVDPFYVLDLSDPAAPAVTGELKIPGFSTYLHPVGEHRVLGVGKAATDDGQVTGFKLSLFDVSDPAVPLEIDTWTLDGAESAAEYDHRAFQMIGSTAVLPIRTWGLGGEEFNGAVLFEIGDTISEVGRITHVEPVQPPTSDCRILTPADVAADSELAWMTADTWMTVQLCDAQDAGGFGTAWCEPLSLDQLGGWFGDPARVADDLAELGADADARLELCYPQDVAWDLAIVRSVAVDGTLYTVSTRRLHAHDLATLDPIGSIDIA